MTQVPLTSVVAIRSNSDHASNLSHCMWEGLQPIDGPGFPQALPASAHHDAGFGGQR